MQQKSALLQYFQIYAALKTRKLPAKPNEAAHDHYFMPHHWWDVHFVFLVNDYLPFLYHHIDCLLNARKASKGVNFLDQYIFTEKYLDVA